jgi:hypothetical protein
MGENCKLKIEELRLASRMEKVLSRIMIGIEGIN